MKLQFNLSFDDLIDLQKNVISKSKHHRKVKYILLSGFPISLLFLNLIFQTPVSLLTIGMILLWVIVFPTIYKKLTLSSTVRIMKKQNLSAFLGPTTMLLDEQGITRKSKNNQNFLAWDQFVVVREDEKHYYLYVSDVQAMILSKSALTDDRTKEAFQRYYDSYFVPLLEKQS
ncbi:YcxB family protein [Paenibacillus xylanexedens]|uniref:YcxB family protein n=1 Tax=Paenibacillus xylanexedens TaxID=528191 RepID=UPI0011A95B51|nr:YcxB family protein [Paenibacillus xylanexedens]